MMTRFIAKIDEQGVAFRYMRYWIETGFSKQNIEQPGVVTRVLDEIDRYFSKPSNTLAFAMKWGDILYVNNRFLCHNRTAFVNRNRPRQLVRSWIKIRKD